MTNSLKSHRILAFPGPVTLAKPAGLILMLTLLCASATATSGPNAVVQWIAAALQGDRDSTLGPPWSRARAGHRPHLHV